MNLYRLTAFTLDPRRGNPAGVWIGDSIPSVDCMQKIASEVGYSETVFIIPSTGFYRRARFFSPEREVDFCGHATIAAVVAMGDMSGDGKYTLETNIGKVLVNSYLLDGIRYASLTSVEPKQKNIASEVLNEILNLLNWLPEDLDESIPPILAYAGNWHLILAAKSRQRLADVHYHFRALRDIMHKEKITTVNLVWRKNFHEYYSRNLFPVGGVVEDPATGAAAAAFGGYLRAITKPSLPYEIHIRQGEDMGCDSLLKVTVQPRGGIIVSGTAVVL